MRFFIRNGLFVISILMLDWRGHSGTPVSMLVQWLSPRSWADSFTEEKETVLSIVAMVPSGSIITIAAVKQDSVENIATFTTNSSTDDMLLGILQKYDTTENSVFVSTSLMGKNVRQTFPQHGQQMSEIVVIVCSDVTLMGPVSFILSRKLLKKTLVVKVGDFRFVDPWLDVATDADHVLFTTEHDKLMTVLQKDFTLLCDIDSFWDDATSECQPCDMACPTYRIPVKCISEDIAFDCQYFLHFFKQQNGKSTKNGHIETHQPAAYQYSKPSTNMFMVEFLIGPGVLLVLIAVVVVVRWASNRNKRYRSRNVQRDEQGLEMMPQ
ncbi:uncharacterized protein LOC128242428 [Mya arenaria]|uniref:uncharacterized protein LOC128242428 n=1 Tax=Mya arenaria TaxID=6604 RepID=UPI0022E34C68|nr:uncharacterized protein LOC128242428 [Mya arenaria]XP_052815536.1 uncharacterized protein LOC128242428 [Mya arenaria]